MEYEDYLIREANEGPPADWSDSPVEWCNECERALELCVCEKATPAKTLPDTWEAIAAQLDYWSDMDREYWRQRREKAYGAWFDRTYGVV